MTVEKKLAFEFSIFSNIVFKNGLIDLVLTFNKTKRKRWTININEITKQIIPNNSFKTYRQGSTFFLNI
jgi:hypothetical protein